MILQCPSCDARFLVPDQAIGVSGRRVRCGRCQYMWQVKPAASATPDIEALMKSAVKEVLKPRPLPPGSNLPAPAKRSRTPLLAALNIVLLAVALILGLAAYAPERFGYAPSTGLTLEGVKITPLEPPHGQRFEAKAPRFSIEGVIVNQTDATQNLPMLRVAFLGENKEWLREKTYRLEDKIVPSGQRTGFRVDSLEGAEGTAYVTVELGSLLELKLRRGGAWELP